MTFFSFNRILCICVHKTLHNKSNSNIRSWHQMHYVNKFVEDHENNTFSFCLIVEPCMNTQTHLQINMWPPWMPAVISALYCLLCYCALTHPRSSSLTLLMVFHSMLLALVHLFSVFSLSIFFLLCHTCFYCCLLYFCFYTT